MVSFKVLKPCPQTGARAGELVCAHGVIPTPAFIPVASQGTVKTLTPQELKESGVNIILGNTYHLYLRPGSDVIQRFGGLHQFMGWDGPIITDSGGYQVISLALLRKVAEEGVLFRSPIDGSEHLFTPESVIRFQEGLGADIIMTLDQPPAYGQGWEVVKEATQRTLRWAERCLRAKSRSEQALFAIVQGGTFPELRKESTLSLLSLNLPGYAMGGLSLGESRAEMWDMVDLTLAYLPQDKPRYLMGVGSPEELVEGVARGIDLFDSALPTRVARNGALFTSTGRYHIRGSWFRDREQPIEEGCTCYTCRSFSVAYLHHLFKAGEMLAPRLATIHNLTFITRLMEDMRQAIFKGDFPDFRRKFLAGYEPTDEQTRLSQKRKWLEKGVL